jgi:hypothetical protein
MRQQSSFAIAFASLCFTSLLAVAQQRPLAPPKPIPHQYARINFQGNSSGWVASIPPDVLQSCSINAPGGYKGNACSVTFNRDLPISPASLSLPPSTTVYIVLANPHPDETIAFNDVTVQQAPEDLAADTLKNLVSPLSNIQFQNLNVFEDAMIGRQNKTTKKPVFRKPNSAKDTVPIEQAKVEDRLKAAGTQLQNAAAMFGCLELYKPFVTDPKGIIVCDQTGILPANALTSPDDEAALLGTAIAAAKSATATDLPVAELKHIDAELNDRITLCAKLPITDQCYKDLDTDQSIENLYNSQVTALTTAQGTLLQAIQTLSTIPPPESPLIYSATLGKNNNATITITGTEVITKTVTTIGTVTINSQATRFVLSSGLMYTSAAYRSYAITSVFTGNMAGTMTQITKTSSIPAIDFPVVFGSYLFRSLSHQAWENKCSNHCAILFSVGVGANLAAKTADIAGGPSFSVGGFLITPVAIGARQNHLLNSLYVGQKDSGIMQSSGLTTANHWVPAGGIAISYTIPTP